MGKLQRSFSALSAGVIAIAGLVASPIAGAEETTAGFDFNPELNTTAMFNSQDLAISGQDGFTCYRIPALTSTPDGSVLAAYDGRPGSCADAPNPNSIVLRKSTDNGETFGEPQIISAGQSGSSKYGYSDPSFIVDWETGTIFNMHVFSLDRTFQAANNSTSLSDRNSIHVSVTKSTDNGDTWSEDEVITQQLFTNNGPFYGKFATSGNGIQLRYGQHKGRLVQPAVVRTANDSYQAMMWMSDDHGATWFAGQAVGTNMNENKVVELSDGTLMMNSRPKNTTERRIAYSDDGGMTWSTDVADPNLPDPGNNASLIRAFPNAPEGSAEAKVLLFSNTASTRGRQNPTVRMSCDDGNTWPIAKSFTPWNTSYTHLTTLPDGNVGILYEGTTNGMKIKFSKFNAAWLGASCLPGASADADTQATSGLQDVQITGTLRNPQASYRVGDTVQVDFTVTNPNSQAVGIFPQAGSGLSNFDPTSSKNCRWINFEAGSAATCANASYTITAADAARGYVDLHTTWLIGAAGQNVAIPSTVLQTVQVSLPRLNVTAVPAAAQVTPNAYQIKLYQGGWFVARYEVSWDETDAQGRVTRKYWQGNNQNRTLGQTDMISLPSNASAIHVVAKRYTGLVWSPWRVSYDNWHDGVKIREISIYGTTLNSWADSKVTAR